MRADVLRRPGAGGAGLGRCTRQRGCASLHLEGRGLSLVPTFFGVNHPITLADPLLQPVLVYPVSREPFWVPGGDDRPQVDALSELLGETRAAHVFYVASARSAYSRSTEKQTPHEPAQTGELSPARHRWWERPGRPVLRAVAVGVTAAVGCAVLVPVVEPPDAQAHSHTRPCSELVGQSEEYIYEEFPEEGAAPVEAEGEPYTS